ncbi:NAD-specific glutamate dehydrogenase [Yasminevirus sp. GU-2018]|uniref:NAD-specific glutamate dehydrogenase n=1 Tax=Yasminevirus sp. GU-2018 TaxID=2420051 RepID=A0A5K0U6T6_9VIRU|nr:NAD-specific glutamate dehydrogenase [Yasminevirus sp. GU-2018]
MSLNYDHEVQIKRDLIKKLYGQRADYDKIESCFNNLAVPERVVIFKIVWEDDSGRMRINTGYRVQHNSALGPYKGGLRFSSDVTLDTFKSLAFEQTFKNSITGLPMGGAKGGSDFSPIGKSESEIRRFCYAFTDELYKHIGPDVDVPAGDIGVGGREIGYIFGRYKQLTMRHDGALTGKNVYGSLLRPEATGYGLLYFVMNHMKYLENKKGISNQITDLSGKTVLISGSGNVAIHAIKKAIHLKAKVLTASDITGVVYAPDGINESLFNVLYELYENRKLLNSYSEYSKHGAVFVPMDVIKTGKNLWNSIDSIIDPSVRVDIALTCATQHEISADSMTALLKRGVSTVAEGSNFGLEDGAVKVCRENKISYIPGKLSNSGGVMCSHLEMQQNAIKHSWTEDEVDEKLSQYISKAYASCRRKADELNIEFDMAVFVVGFERLMDASIKLGYTIVSRL